MNKVVLVTGSSKGIGRAIIKEFSKNGYDVVINYNTSYLEAKTLEEEIKIYNVKVLLIKRKNEPYKDMWALVGGALYNNEDVEEGMLWKRKKLLFKRPNLL